MSVRIIGVDCATDAKRIGLALGEWSGNRLRISDVAIGGERSADPVTRVRAWMSGYVGRVLIAIDAPLGWPEGMRTALQDHAAGGSLSVTDADAMFRRATDLEIKERLGKTPLDVGADRIARTAYKALSMLTTLRSTPGVPIPLAWDHQNLAKISAIEVYPAALLAAYKVSAKDYKKPEQRVVRHSLLSAVETKLGDQLEFTADREIAYNSADALDGILCVLAAAEFLNGNAEAPDGEEQVEKARIEGWIWSPPRRTPNAHSNRWEERPHPRAARWKTPGP